jgi:hypothetical protein
MSKIYLKLFTWMQNRYRISLDSVHFSHFIATGSGFGSALPVLIWIQDSQINTRILIRSTDFLINELNEISHV